MSPHTVSPCSDPSLVAAFYADVGYTCTLDAAETILTVRTDGAVVGAVRLVPDRGVLVLRGMHVAPRLQRRGMGTSLLDAAAAEIRGRECWCLPYPHLEDFYAGAGFRRQASATAPRFLRERAQSYAARGVPVILMRRPPTGA